MTSRVQSTAVLGIVCEEILGLSKYQNTTAKEGKEKKPFYFEGAEHFSTLFGVSRHKGQQKKHT